MEKNIQTLLISDIRRDSGAQFRVGGLNEAQVESLIDAIERDAKIPPIIAFYDGSQKWMADGDHRIEAHLRSGKTEIEVDLREGSQDDAIFYGTGANADHGLPRSPKTKRAQVVALLEKWPHLGVSGIAKQAKVSRQFVYQVQNDNPHLSTLTGDTREYTDKHGNKAVMNVGNMTFKKEPDLSESSNAIKNKMRSTIENATEIGERIAKTYKLLKDNTEEGQTFADYVEAENGLGGTVEGAHLLMQFAERARKSEEDDASLFQAALNALAAFSPPRN